MPTPVSGQRGQLLRMASRYSDTWLNTIIKDKTLLWWGGFGRSTEHTAYLRLKAGYRAPQSGSCALNGAMISTQIGTQIFTAPLALMSPGDPEQAAALIRKAASVSHDGAALDCAAYLGALLALAFEHRSLDTLLEEAEPFAAGDQLRRLLHDVRGICVREDDWRRVREWLDPRYGYGVFAGACPIQTNHAMVLAALLLGGDDFRRAVTIAASAGWDTDCNAGSVGCLNGVRLGLAAIPADLREPVADRLLVVTAEGGRCVSDEAGILLHYRDLVASAAGRVSTPVFLDFDQVADNFSTQFQPHALRHPGGGGVERGSPRRGGRAAPERGPVRAVLRRRRPRAGTAVDGAATPSRYHQAGWRVPANDGMPLFRLGLELAAPSGARTPLAGRLGLLNVDWNGAPHDFRQSGMLMSSIWNLRPYWLRAWVSAAREFAPDFELTYCVSHSAENGLVTLGTRAWRDYAVESRLRFSLHRSGGLVLRARGLRRYYAALFSGGDRLAIVARQDGAVHVLAQAAFPYEMERFYALRFAAVGDRLSLAMDGVPRLEGRDHRYRSGGAGFVIDKGTMIADGFRVRRCDMTSSYLGRNGKPDTKCAKNLHHGANARIAFTGQRFVQAWTT